MKKICIVGSNGLLGKKFMEKFHGLEILGTIHESSPTDKNNNLINIDIIKYENLEKILKFNPDLLINCAAITNVDYCEQFPDIAYQVNVIGTKNLVKLAKQLECKFVHFSTDGIFSGKNSLYDENDVPNPINYYGKTKLASENQVKELNDYLICRTNLLYGYVPNNFRNKKLDYQKPKNFVMWVLHELSKNHQLRIVDDQISNPTLVDNIPQLIFELIEKNLVGIYNTVDLSCLSRFDFAKKIAEAFGYSKSLISPINSIELNQIAPRPKQTCLDCLKIQNQGIKLHSVDESLKILFSTIKNHEPTIISKSKIKVL